MVDALAAVTMAEVVSPEIVPLGTAQVLSPRRKLDDDGVPVTVPIAVADAINPPLTAGTVRAVAVPATASGEIVTSPEVFPNILIPPLVVVFAPRINWGVAAVSVIAPPNVPVVPIFNAFAALMPPLVRSAPVVLDVASSVDGRNVDALAPVPPNVNRVVAPAHAVNETVGVVTEVVKSGEVNDWTPVNVCAASCRAVVYAASSNVTVLAAVGPANVICWPKIGSVLAAFGSVTLYVLRAPVGGASVAVPDVAFLNPMLPTALPAVPNSNEVVDPKTPVVAATVVGVPAPTVPLILIEAVPVRFVTVPLDGVPKTPPFTTGAPAVPTLTPSAVKIPVPVVLP